MKALFLPVAVFFALLLVAIPRCPAQRNGAGPREPHIGYAYPAGGRAGTTLEVTIGGQYLDGVSGLHFSDQGIHATVIKHTKPLLQREVNQIRQKLDEARKKVEGDQPRRNPRRQRARVMEIVRVAKEMGVTEEQLKAFNDYRKRRNDPKRQLNPSIAETVSFRFTLDPEARLGKHELRLVTKAGLSNPIGFYIGQSPEYQETEPNNTTAGETIESPLPMVLNGQIMPGDVDRFRFNARRGDRLVIVVRARELMPYLADAVPGWFQATLALYDANGREVAYSDDYQFRPDPVLYFEIPEKGLYELEIKDAIYRGREDFVYRISVGPLPFVTNMFPLGCRQGGQATVDVTGWNLPVKHLTLETESKEPGIHLISVRKRKWVSNQKPFAVDSLGDCMEKEPNNDAPHAQLVEPPVIVNGRIDQPGDHDVYRFKGRAGGEIILDVQARRLGSPLDSLLRITDADGRELIANDDHEDKGAGLTTHHADSFIELTLPSDGMYFVHLGDTQNKGGDAYGYRLRISARQPDFQLRVVPSTINARAGMTVPITVHALRKDGFSGDIVLALKEPPPGFKLSGPWVPAGLDKMQMTLTVPGMPREGPARLQIEGHANIKGQMVRRSAVPADDMTQAFIYHHLVPSKELLVSVTARGRSWNAAQARARARFQGKGKAKNRGKAKRGAAWKQRPRPVLNLIRSTPVKLPSGGTTRIDIPLPNSALASRAQFQLRDAPEGITLQKDSSVKGRMRIILSADGQKVQPGLKGNLIVDVFLMSPNAKNKRRTSFGTLPAIPFEVVARP